MKGTEMGLMLNERDQEIFEVLCPYCRQSAHITLKNVNLIKKWCSERGNNEQELWNFTSNAMV